VKSVFAFSPRAARGVVAQALDSGVLMLEYERDWVFGTPVCRSVDHDACHLAMSMPMNIVISDD
jgi:hypothetical protein